VEVKSKRETKVEEGFVVDKDSRQRFLMSPLSASLKTAFKCSGCQLLTVHVGSELTMFDALEVDGVKLDKIVRRVYGCTNCGKFSTK